MEFTEQFDELAVLAHRTAFRILGSRADAEEVTQETLAKALVRWARVESHSRAWVCRVAANHSIGLLRKRRSIPLPSDLDTVTDTARPDRVDLQRALLELPRRQREVLVLRYLLDLSEQETARELGVEVGTVKTHSHRALRALRVTLDDQPSPDDKEIGDVRTPR